MYAMLFIAILGFLKANIQVIEISGGGSATANRRRIGIGLGVRPTSSREPGRVSGTFVELQPRLDIKLQPIVTEIIRRVRFAITV